MKKNNNFVIRKGLAFLTVIVCFGLGVTVFANLVRNSNGLEALTEPNYVNTNDLYNYEQNFYIGLDNLLKYKNEEYIKLGNTISKEEFERKKQDMFYEWYNQLNEKMGLDYNNSIIENNITIYQILKERFEILNADKVKSLYNSMIENDLKDYYSLLQKINNKEGLYYYASNGENTYTNCEGKDRSYFTGFKSYYLHDKQGEEVFPTNIDGKYILYTSENIDAGTDNAIYIAANDEYIAKKQLELDKKRIFLQNGIIVITCLIAILLIALIYLIWKTGKKENDDGVYLSVIDKVYTDITALAILGTVFAWGAVCVALIENRFLNYTIMSLKDLKPDFWLMVLCNTVLCAVGLMLFLSLIRHIKNGTLFKHSLTYKIFRKLFGIIKTIFDAGPLSVRVIYYAIFKMKQLSDIANGVREIKNGNLEYVIDIKGDNDLAKFANDINSITDGLKTAVAKEIKAERMKSELVTNVSHDLKTPLTSIINYVDLLSKEKLAPEVANDYVVVLKQKSEKLKLLTQDLFEISKVQSGNISIDFEKIDISVLIRQSLGEFDEQITSSSLEFKANIEDNTFILADGKRLSRVFENLIGNALKYSLAGTRVYIDEYTENNNVIIEFKNIANYEMNFKEDEILERFVRGDESRTTDGNGLGLAIAENYVSACGGTLSITVDGDLFKATIKFNKA